MLYQSKFMFVCATMLPHSGWAPTEAQRGLVLSKRCHGVIRVSQRVRLPGSAMAIEHGISLWWDCMIARGDNRR